MIEPLKNCRNWKCFLLLPVLLYGYTSEVLVDQKLTNVSKRLIYVAEGCGVIAKEESNEENAVWMGKVMISQSMIRHCASEDELAAIVAHEKAHLVLKHGKKAWYEKLGGWFASWFVDESKPRFRGPPDPKSVERENEADEKGLMLMAEAGYDPRAAVDFWTRYYERIGWWEGDGTHPKPCDRLAHLNALMPKAVELFNAVKNGGNPDGNSKPE